MYKDTAFSNEIKVKTGFFSRFFFKFRWCENHSKIHACRKRMSARLLS